MKRGLSDAIAEHRAAHDHRHGHVELFDAPLRAGGLCPPAQNPDAQRGHGHDRPDQADQQDVCHQEAFQSHH